ncbi:MAG: hypothetical protein AAB699_00340 [Patescibacteria group bacterium]
MQSALTKTIVSILLAAILAGAAGAPLALAQTAPATPPAGYFPQLPDSDKKARVFQRVDADTTLSRDAKNTIKAEYDNIPERAEQLQEEYLTPDERGVPRSTPPAGAPGAPGAPGAGKKETNTVCGGKLSFVYNAVVGDSSKNFECAAAWIASAMLWISARTLWFSGVLLNITLTRTLDLNEFVANFPLVDIGWQVIRDIANIVFIFIVLWAGISITLGIGDGKPAWGLLANVVLVALFINFSLFITKAVVDASNIAALHFYDRIRDPEHLADKDSGLSEAFMNAFKLGSLYNTKVVQSGAGDSGASSYLQAVGGQNLTFTNIILIGIFGSLFIIVSAFVFFAAAILFLIRAITLMMLMILSPLAFVGLILPGASSLAHQWWSKLWSQSFFAPIYMALAYVVVRTINDQRFNDFLFSGGSTNWAAAITGNQSSSLNIIFAFILLIGLMLMCLIVAQSLGAGGSGMVMQMGGRLRAMGMGAVAGGAGILARTGLRGGEALASLDFVKKRVRPETLQKMKKWSVRNLDERFGGSAFGNTAIGKFIRERTTGALVQAKIAGKTVQEAHLESKEMETKRRDIGLRNDALRASDGQEKVYSKVQTEQRREELLKDITENTQAIIDTYNRERSAGKPPTPEEMEKYTLATAHLASPDALKNELKTLEAELDELAAQYKKAQREIEDALSRMSIKGFLEMPTEHFFNKRLMDVRVLGLDKYMALMHSDGILSHTEKEQVNEARFGEMSKESDRVENRVEDWYDRQPYYLKVRNEHREKVEAYEKANKKWEGGNASFVTAQQKYEAERVEREKIVQNREGLQRKHTEAQGLYEQKKRDYLAQGYDPRLMASAIGEPPIAPALPNLPTEPVAPAPPTTPRPEPPSPVQIPGMPGFIGEWRRTLRNMLNLEEFENINEFYPKLFNQRHWTATVRQGLINRIRESKNFTNQEKETARENKSYNIRMMSDNILGEDYYEMEALPGAAREKKRKDLEKEFREDPGAFLRKLREDAAKPGKVGEEGGRRLERHQIGMWRIREMIGGKNQEEVGMMPGRFLFTPEVAMLIDRGKANSAQMRGKDEGEKVEHLEIVLPFEAAFLRGEINEDYFTSEMQDFLDWWRHHSRGREWYSQTIEQPVYKRQPDGTLKVIDRVTRETNDPGEGYRWVNVPGVGVKKVKRTDLQQLDDDEFEDRYGFRPPPSA